MLEIVAVIISAGIVLALVIQYRKWRKEVNDLWDRVAVNDVHIQRLQEKNGLEVEPTSSREKVKQLLKRLTHKEG